MNRKQSIFVFAICTALWLSGALLIFASIIANAIHNAGYGIQACQIDASTIVPNNDIFQGLVNIKYELMTSSWIEVYIGDTWNTTKAFLNTNYPVGKMVGCYVSDTNVRLTLYSQNSLLLAGASVIALSIAASLMYLIVVLIDCCRRKGYRDLDDRSRGYDIEIKRAESPPRRIETEKRKKEEENDFAVFEAPPPPL
jgi:hypothetical protein